MGLPDHVHILLSLPSTLVIAKAVQLIKGRSSKWVLDTFSYSEGFEWQEGYGAFSISVSHGDLHSRLRKASSQEELSRRVRRLPEETQNRV
jgi:REP element-mobilizing transposase RayT